MDFFVKKNPSNIKIIPAIKMCIIIVCYVKSFPSNYIMTEIKWYKNLKST